MTTTKDYSCLNCEAEFDTDVQMNAHIDFEHAEDYGLVTCDGCDATSETGWGDTAYCLDCSHVDEVCLEHQRTHYNDETCPLCDAEDEA